MMRLALVVVFAAVLLPLSPAVAGDPPNGRGHYAPQDTCSADPAARAFLGRLHEAQVYRDPQALRALAAPGMTSDFGGGGIEDYLEMADSDPHEWAVLGQTLSLGCRLEGETLTAPWFFSLDLGDADPTEILLAVGPAVPVYAAQNARSAIKGTLDWQLVSVIGPHLPELTFLEVRLLDGSLTGFVPVEQLRSQLDQRLMASKQNGEWKISALVSGD